MNLSGNGPFLRLGSSGKCTSPGAFLLDRAPKIEELGIFQEWGRIPKSWRFKMNG